MDKYLVSFPTARQGLAVNFSALVYQKFCGINSKTSPFIYWRKIMVIRRISKITAGEIEKILGKEVTAMPDKTEGESILNGTARLKIHGGTDQDLILLAQKNVLVKEVWSWELLWRQIPGHMKAYTYLLTLVAGFVAYAMTDRIGTSIVGAILISLGEFSGNQATHLAIHHKEEDAPTWIERRQQVHPHFFRDFGLAIFALGLWIAFHR